MPLISLFRTDPGTVEEFTIQQVVSFSGDGKLKDGSECSREFREYLSKVKSEKLRDYVEQCLSDSFDKSGLVLQDLVNELGRRLDFQVTDGFYSGRRNEIGNDGLWLAPEGNSIIAEVKTTDAYRISMDTVAGYRDSLIRDGQVTEDSSILVIVGRQDTGELEAQVRGSRHAWDIRLISADSLSKLVLLKEDSDEDETGGKIRSILVPVEYTRVDGLVDVVFTTARDVENDIDDSGENSSTENVEEASARSQTTDRAALQALRERLISQVSDAIGDSLLKRTRAMYWTAERDSRVACTISKRYESGPGYWYAFHPKWRQFLAEGKSGRLVLGCMGRPDGFAIPLTTLEPFLDQLNTTTTEKGMYWHIHLNELSDGTIELVIPKRENLSLTEFSVSQE